jgi:hypothetical protein
MNKKRRLRLQAHRPRADGPGTTADGTVSRGFMLSFHVTFVSAERGLGRSVRQFGQAALIGLCSYCALARPFCPFALRGTSLSPSSPVGAKPIQSR